MATAGRNTGKSRTLLGAHRPFRSAQHYREFTSHSTALRYLAAWVAKYADELVAELGTTYSQ